MNKSQIKKEIAGICAMFFIMTCFLYLLRGAQASETVVQKNAQGHWELRVDGEPYFIKGIDYRVTKVGQGPDDGTLKDWAYYDYNRNGIIDSPYEAWVDRNRNNEQDPDEPSVGDFQLLKDMGANTIRWYVNDFKGQKANKKLLRDLYRTYGIRVAVGDKFGAYTIASGASWEKGTDYRDPRQRARMMASVRKMVLTHKDEPYTLLWLLGNENNLKFTNTNAADYPRVYAEFLNEAARLIHQLDGKHPVALVNGDVRSLFHYAKHAPDVDIFGTNSYRGPHGFGDLWEKVKNVYDKPVLITEYGGSYAPGSDEEEQARYHKGCWLNIRHHRAHGEGAGNSIGGFAFEWVDEWWKAGKPYQQAARGSVGRQGGGEMKWSQEYCGMAGQGNGRTSPFIRQLRQVYYTYQEAWRTK